MCNQIDFSAILAVKVMRDGDGDGKCQEEDGKWVPCPPGVEDGSVVDRLGRSISKIPLGTTIGSSGSKPTNWGPPQGPSVNKPKPRALRRSSKPQKPKPEDTEQTITERLRNLLTRTREKAAVRAAKNREILAAQPPNEARRRAAAEFIKPKGITEILAALGPEPRPEDFDAERRYRIELNKFKDKRKKAVNKRAAELKEQMEGVFNHEFTGMDGKKYKVSVDEVVDFNKDRIIEGDLKDMTDKLSVRLSFTNEQGGEIGFFHFDVLPEKDKIEDFHVRLNENYRGTGVVGHQYLDLLKQMPAMGYDSLTASGKSDTARGYIGASHWPARYGADWATEEARQEMIDAFKEALSEEDDEYFGGKELRDQLEELIQAAEQEDFDNRIIHAADLILWNEKVAEKLLAEREALIPYDFPLTVPRSRPLPSARPDADIPDADIPENPVEEPIEQQVEKYLNETRQKAKEKADKITRNADQNLKNLDENLREADRSGYQLLQDPYDEDETLDKLTRDYDEDNPPPEREDYENEEDYQNDYQTWEQDRSWAIDSDLSDAERDATDHAWYVMQNIFGYDFTTPDGETYTVNVRDVTVRPNGTIEVSGTIEHGNDTAAEFVRTFSSGTVEHDQLITSDDYQNKGIGSTFNTINEALYSQMGIYEILTEGVSAPTDWNGRNGFKGATHWPRQGFNWKNEATKRKYIAMIRKAIQENPDISPAEKAILQNLIETAEKEPWHKQTITAADLLQWEGAEEWFQRNNMRARLTKRVR